MATWDPTTYLQFADQRGRPFADLLSQVKAPAPRRVVDLGCGPGQLTATLLDRWPTAAVLGLDAAPEMVERARALASDRLGFAVADLRQWWPDEPVDVVISNAALQWVPNHRSLLPRLVAALRPGGWLAFQVPGNFSEPSHRLLHGLANDRRFAPRTREVEWPGSAEPADYLSDLIDLGCRVEVWETTYLHVLSGPDPVFRWISGTGARPVLHALDGDQRNEFEIEYKALLAEAYPPRAEGTVLPFRRIFAVAQVPVAGELGARVDTGEHRPTEERR